MLSGSEKPRPPPAPTLSKEVAEGKRRRKPPKHLAEFFDEDIKGGGGFHDSADEDNILNIDEDQTDEYNPSVRTKQLFSYRERLFSGLEPRLFSGLEPRLFSGLETRLFSGPGTRFLLSIKG